jgi:CRP/FNR family transcriptional regulator, cyclic AMP receptor protein
MAKSKRAPMLTPAGVLDWTGVQTQRVEYEPATMIFAQGDPATSVMYVEKGVVRLSVLSHAGKEAVVALLHVGHFFGEGCLAGQSQRMATAKAMAPCTILAVEKPEMVRQLHAQPACWRGTVNPRRLTAPFRSCLKKSWPKWSARHARGSTSS